MKLLAFSILRQRIGLLKASMWFTFQQEMVYAANNWAGLASTSFYTLSMLLFINVIYGKVKIFAGYSYYEMLFFFLVAQFSYYLNWTFTQKGIYDFIQDVNKGNLDMVLIKPVPTLFYLFTRVINPVPLIKQGLPPTVAIILFINWSELGIGPVNLLIGLIIFVLGLWILHVLAFISALPVFWLGESTSIVDLTLQMSSGNGVMIPLEGYSRTLQITLGAVFPVLIATQFSTSAFLNKTNPLMLLSWSVAVAIIAGVLRIKLWNIAIKNYTSASS